MNKNKGTELGKKIINIIKNHSYLFFLFFFITPDEPLIFTIFFDTFLLLPVLFDHYLI